MDTKPVTDNVVGEQQLFQYEAEIRNRLHEAARLLRNIQFGLCQITSHFRADVDKNVVEDYHKQASRLKAFLNEIAKPLSEPAAVPSPSVAQPECPHLHQDFPGIDVNKCLDCGMWLGQFPPARRSVAQPEQACAKCGCEYVKPVGQPFTINLDCVCSCHNTPATPSVAVEDEAREIVKEFCCDNPMCVKAQIMAVASALSAQHEVGYRKGIEEGKKLGKDA